jgi:hypothetical protein
MLTTFRTDMATSPTPQRRFALLRPGMPSQALADIVGSDAATPGRASEGECLGLPDGLGARIDANGNLGIVSFFKGFPPTEVVEGVQMGMPMSKLMAAHPTLTTDDAVTLDDDAYSAWRTLLNETSVLRVRCHKSKVIHFALERLDATYPPYQTPVDFPPMTDRRAYDLQLLVHEARRGTASNCGWAYGLPPGITSAQWPLDPVSGYPLMHGFTLLLPEPYRVHGPDIVAISFFATSPDQNDGGAVADEQLCAAVYGTMDAPDEDDALYHFWHASQRAHPRLHRMKDVLDYEYAVLLLTQTEFDGEFCQPPAIPSSEYINRDQRPKWLDMGAGAAYAADYIRNGPSTVEERYRYDFVRSAPEATLEWHRAIECTPRAQDPNAGAMPEELFGDETESRGGYRSHFYWKDGVCEAANYREHEWGSSHRPNHIGGTMRPAQGTPEMSPYYVEFEEYFGAYNFGGGGNAQLDFYLMKFDWACG